MNGRCDGKTQQLETFSIHLAPGLSVKGSTEVGWCLDWVVTLEDLGFWGFCFVLFCFAHEVVDYVCQMVMNDHSEVWRD